MPLQPLDDFPGKKMKRNVMLILTQDASLKEKAD
jgi:hypothetical protein